MARQAGDGAPRPGSREYRAQVQNPRPQRKLPSQALTGPLSAPSFNQGQATQKVQRARQKVPAAHAPLPQFPVLRKYTAPQRQSIMHQQAVAINNRRLPGEGAQQAHDRIERNGTQQDKTQIRLLHRVMLEQAGGGDPIVGAQRLAAQGLKIASGPRAHPGPKPSGWGTGITGPLAAVTNKFTSPGTNAVLAAAPGFGRLASPAVHDLVSLPRNVVVSGYVTGKALEKAARGKPQELKQLGTTIKNTDPVALAIQGRWSEAARAAGQHPLNTALELSGIRAPLRGAGKLAGLSTERDLATVPSTAMVQHRQLSTNPITRAVQISRDEKKFGKAQSLRKQADEADHQGHMELANEMRAQAARVDPRLMTVSQVEHRADVDEGMSQSQKRRGKSAVNDTMKQSYVHPREGGHMQRLNIEAQVPIRRVNEDGNFDVHGQISVPHMRNDIQKAINGLKAEHDSLPYRKQRLNKRMQRHLTDLLAKSDTQLLNVAHKSLDASAEINRLDERNIARGMLDPTEARIAKNKVYAIAHMGARVERRPGMEKAQLLDKDGNPLRPNAIEQHMVDHGVDPASVAWMSQRPQDMLGAYNISGRRAKGASTKPRTGAAVIQGLLDTHPRNVAANAVRLQQLESANINWEHSLSGVALRDPIAEAGQTPKIRQFAKADQHALDELYARTGQKWRFVRIVPWQGRESQLQHALDHADSEGFVGREHPISQVIEDALKEHQTGEGPFALVPDAWAQRTIDHAQIYQGVHPLFRAVNGLFRHTVLPLSTSFLAGNAIEADLRAIIRSPRVLHNFVTYKRVLAAVKGIDPEEAARLEDAVGVGHFGYMERGGVYTSAGQFSNSRFKPVADALHKARTTPGPGTIANLYGKYTHFVFEHVNGLLEHPARQAMAGAHMREHARLPQFSAPGRMSNDAERAYHDAAMGYTNTSSQLRLADDVAKNYGRYENMSPRQRKTALTWSPFFPWARNALQFLTGVLPRDHPLLTAAIAAADTWTQDYRKIHGLDEWTKGHVPAFLLGSIPTGGGGHLRVSRFTPFGLGSDPTGTLAQLVLPQFAGVLDAANGSDWTGKELRNSDGSPYTTPQKVTYAAGQAAASLVPGLGLIQRAIAAPPKSIAGKAGYVTNPFRVTKAKKSKSKSSTGWGGSSSSSKSGWGAASSSGKTGWGG